MIRYFFLLLAFGAAAAHADMSACASASMKKPVDEQIHLYTLCITQGNMSRENLARAFNNRGAGLGGADDAASLWRDSLQARKSLYDMHQPYRERAAGGETVGESLAAFR